VKYLLLSDIKKMVQKNNFTGNTLDIGCGEKPYKNLFPNCTYLGIDFEEYSINKDYLGEKPDMYFSKDYVETSILPFDNENFDNVFFFQVLEHHKDPQTLFKEVNRVLKSGGQVAFSVPFIEGIHESPHDYQRFTEFGIRELLKKFGYEEISIYKQGRIFSVLYFLSSEALNKFASKNKAYYFLATFVYILLLLPIQYICLLLDKLTKSEDIVINYLVLAKKVKNVNLE
jgi:SAM-dependent methyltransferase